MCVEKKGSLDPAGILGVGGNQPIQCIPITNRYDRRGCTQGGLHPNVVVQFRPTEEYTDKFGFDWVRVGDSRNQHFLTSLADTPFNQNIGYHYKNQYETCKETIEVEANISNFRVNGALQRNYKNTFDYLQNISLYTRTFIPRFQYYIPVITLMPKDSRDNPHNVNLEAKLDSIVQLGPNRPNGLKLGVANDTDATLVNSAFCFSTNNISLTSKKNALTIRSKGKLYRDVIVYVYTEECHIPCGAFKLLANANKVRHLKINVIPVQTGLSGNEINISISIENKKKFYSLMAQALITVEMIILEDGMNFSSANPIPRRFINSSLRVLKYDSIHDRVLGQTIGEFQDWVDALNPNIQASNEYRFYVTDAGAYSEKIHNYLAGGARVGGKKVFYFNSNNFSTPTVLAHEFGHCLGLQHSFINKAAHPSEHYTSNEVLNPPPANVVFEYQSTVNIMDYTNEYKKKSFSYEQWKILNSNL